jgi:hypothetical protein
MYTDFYMPKKLFDPYCLFLLTYLFTHNTLACNVRFGAEKCIYMFPKELYVHTLHWIKWIRNLICTHVEGAITINLLQTIILSPVFAIILPVSFSEAGNYYSGEILCSICWCHCYLTWGHKNILVGVCSSSLQSFCSCSFASIPIVSSQFRFH